MGPARSRRRSRPPQASIRDVPGTTHGLSPRAPARRGNQPGTPNRREFVVDMRAPLEVEPGSSMLTPCQSQQGPGWQLNPPVQHYWRLSYNQRTHIALCQQRDPSRRATRSVGPDARARDPLKRVRRACKRTAALVRRGAAGLGGRHVPCFPRAPPAAWPHQVPARLPVHRGRAALRRDRAAVRVARGTGTGRPRLVGRIVDQPVLDGGLHPRGAVGRSPHAADPRVAAGLPSGRPRHLARPAGTMVRHPLARLMTFWAPTRRVRERPENRVLKLGGGMAAPGREQRWRDACPNARRRAEAAQRAH